MKKLQKKSFYKILVSLFTIVYTFIPPVNAIHSLFAQVEPYSLTTYSNSSYSIEEDLFYTGETVYVRGTSTTSQRLQLSIVDPDSTIFALTSTNNGTSLSGNYSLPDTAKLGTWTARLEAKEKQNDPWIIQKTVEFEVDELSTEYEPSTVQTEIGMCMEDAYGSKLNCTANDVSVANVVNIDILDDGCTSPDDTVTFKASWQIQSTATQNYNVGLYFPTGGQNSALNGTCSVSILPNYPVPPWYNFDNNVCGDVSSAAPVSPEITLTVQCLDTNGDNLLNLPYCSSWHQQKSTCNGIPDAIPLNSSKCNCEDGFTVPITVPYSAYIEVVKDLIPSDDSGRFNLHINEGEIYEVTEENIGDGGTTGKTTVGAGTNDNPGDTHTVSETAFGTTNLNDYSSSISCVYRGTTTVVASSQDAGPLNVPVEKDDDILCTITNSKKSGSIKVNKLLDANGDDTFETTNPTSYTWSIDGSGTYTMGGTQSGLLIGDYSINENTSLTGYKLKGWFPVGENGSSCTSLPTGSTYTTLPASVSVSANQTTEITICNEAIPGTLTVKKVAYPLTDETEFSVSASTSNGQIIGSNAGSISNILSHTYDVKVGNYSVSETVPTNWYEVSNTCDSVYVGPGEDEECTITNNRYGSISGFKLNDRDGDDATNDDRNGLAGWTIILYKKINDVYVKIDETLTSNSADPDVRGYFEFTGLEDGEYKLEEDISVMPSWYKLLPLDHIELTLGIGEDKEDVNFVNVEYAEVEVCKEDTEGNSIAGWTVYVGTDSKTTGADGCVTFDKVKTGTHTVTEKTEEGWTQTGNTSYEFTAVSGGEYGPYTFVNFEHSDVVVCKIDTEKNPIEDWEVSVNDVDKLTDMKGCATFTITEPGEYTITEEDRTGWTQIGDTSYNFTAESGKEYGTYTFTNFEHGSINVCKEDAEGEPIMGWNVYLGEIEKTTGEDGCTTYDITEPGEYTISEESRDGWFAVTPTEHTFEPTSGYSNTFTFVNYVMTPQLQIEKLNNTGGLGMSAGDIVTYTIIVKAPEDDIDGKYLLENVVVTDILPEGFEYILGSWTGTINEPVYNGVPAKWEIGDMEEGDIVVLTYKAVISTTQEPGLYPDIAWVSGEDILGGSVLGISTVEPTENFVGTDVLVVAEEELEEGDVLGATTEIQLPATGANTYLTIGGLVSMILGFILLLFKPKKKIQMLVIAATLLFGMNIFISPKATYAAESDKINVQISQPQTPTNKTSFNIGFVALDLDSRPLTIECFETTYGKFGPSYNTYSGNCVVGTTIVTGSATYQFTVKATANDGSGDYKISKPVTVVVDLEMPTPITNYTKTEGVCTYTLSFTTGSKSTKVQIFRSATQPFTANTSTLIKEISVTPNQYVTYTDTVPVCGQEYFYAVRTIDPVSNTSPIVTDNIVKTVQVQAQPTTTTIIPGTTTTPGTVVLSAQNTTDDEEEVKGEEEIVDEVEKEEDEDEDKEDSEKDEEKEKSNTWLIVVIAILLVGGIGYVYVNRKRKTTY